MSNLQDARDAAVDTDAAYHDAPTPMTAQERKIIFASSLGTIFEWYDFYLYGALAAIIAKQFFTALEPTSAFIFALLAFAAGFIVRPIGAVIFGSLGDMIGRKYTFLATIVIMGVSTTLVAVLPTSARPAPSLRSRWYCCGCCRVWPWAESTAVRPSMWPSTRRRTAAAPTPRGCRRRRLSACSCRWW
jgi:MFS family permease